MAVILDREQTIESIRTALARRQSATLLAVNTMIVALGKRGDTADLADLSALVKCDSVLMARVIALANRLGLKPGGWRVTGLLDAFHVLGIDRLRSVVLSTLLAEHTNDRNQVQREMAILSLVSGLVAQSLAHRAGEDGEQAFICGALRNYGRLLLSTFHAGVFERARAEGQRRNHEDGAFRELFGITSSELTLALLSDTQLCPRMVEAITKPANFATPERGQNRQLECALAAESFAELLFDSRIAPDTFRALGCSKLNRALPQAFTTDDDLHRFLEAQRTRFSEYAAYPEFASMSERPIISITRRLAGKPLHRSSIVPGRNSFHPATEVVAAAAPVLQPHALPRLASDLRASDGLLFVLDPLLGAFRLATGVGAWARQLHGAAVFSPRDKNMFGLCTTLRQTLAIHDLSRDGMRSYLPDSMRGAGAPAAFFIMPLGHAVVSQVLVVGWSVRRQVVPPTTEVVLGYNSAALELVAI